MLNDKTESMLKLGKLWTENEISKKYCNPSWVLDTVFSFQHIYIVCAGFGKVGRG